jgi:hypothetical protein
MAKVLLRSALLTLASLAFAHGSVFGGAIHIEWEKVDGATGYRAYFGKASGQYTGVQDMGLGGPGASGSSRTGTVTGLEDCTTYYVAIKAYDDRGGISSAFSNEVVGWARPAVTSITPSSVVQGDQLTLDVYGANFDSGAEIAATIDGLPTDIDGQDLIVLDDLSVVSCNQLQAMVTIEPTARGLRAMEVGDFDINFEIVNPDTVFGRGLKTIDVGLNETRADINRDDPDTRDRVDGKDLAWLAHAHASSEGEAFYNPDADLDGNGMVDGADLAELASRFGRCWNGSGWSDSACN